MENEDLSHPASEVWRLRRQRFLEARDNAFRQPVHFEIDIDDLIGAKGSKLEPSLGDWSNGMDLDSEHPDSSANPVDPNYLSPGMDMTYNATDFPDWINDFEGCETYVKDLLTRLGSQCTAASVVEPITAAIGGLREPIRTVAINCLVLGIGSEAAARAFRTSVETIEFLSDVALDQIAILVPEANFGRIGE